MNDPPTLEDLAEIDRQKKIWADNYYETCHKVANRSLTLQQHLEFLRRPVIRRQHKTMIILLNSLFKKLLANEGVDDQDDVFRQENNAKRLKVATMLK